MARHGCSRRGDRVGLSLQASPILSIFTPHDPDTGIDMRPLLGVTHGVIVIDSLTISENRTVAVLTRRDGDLVITMTYRGEAFTADGTSATGGTFHSVTYAVDGVEVGTYSAIEPQGRFIGIVGNGADFTFHQVDSIRGTRGDDILWAAGDNGDSVDAGKGDDVIELLSRQTTADHRVDGGEGTDQLAFVRFIEDYFDLRGGTFLNIESLAVGRGLTVVLGSDQFGSGHISLDAHVSYRDDPFSQVEWASIYVVMASPGTLDLSQLTLDDGVWLAAIGTRRADTIVGTAWGDVIHGDRGADTVTGGGGADIFYFGHKKEFAPAAQGIDVIRDFGGGDVIDMSDVDGKERKGFQPFKFVDGEGRAASRGGRLTSEYKDGTTTILGNRDHDRKPEIVLALEGKIELDASDFIL
jgi:Ca2+-binding RTX toxin-like protein